MRLFITNRCGSTTARRRPDLHQAATAAIFVTALLTGKANATEVTDTIVLPEIPERAVVIMGDPNNPGARHLVSVLYAEDDLSFSDPRAPRFLFLDKQGKIAMGIGGYVKGTMQYDMRGSIDDGSNFTTYMIPVPNNPAQKNAFFATVNSSTVFLKMVGKTSDFGDFTLYIQTDFTGGGTGGYELKLKYAYASLGNLTAGLNRSTFVDGASGFPVIDDAGPAGQNSARNVMLQYRPTFDNGITLAASVEMPDADYTVNSTCSEIKQRVPDIPVYIQYGWGAGNHVRLSGILRNLSYRDLKAGKNHFVTGWGVMLSGVSGICGGLTAYWQGTYGKGIARYVQDLAGYGYDLIPEDGTSGHMTAPASLGLVGGLTYDFTKKFSIGAAYSMCRLYDQLALGSDTYRDGQYIVANMNYNVIPDLQLGLEYLHGVRTDISGIDGRANRVMAMLKYSF